MHCFCVFFLKKVGSSCLPQRLNTSQLIPPYNIFRFLGNALLEAQVFIKNGSMYIRLLSQKRIMWNFFLFLFFFLKKQTYVHYPNEGDWHVPSWYFGRGRFCCPCFVADGPSVLLSGQGSCINIQNALWRIVTVTWFEIPPPKNNQNTRYTWRFHRSTLKHLFTRYGGERNVWIASLCFTFRRGNLCTSFVRRRLLGSSLCLSRRNSYVFHL